MDSINSCSEKLKILANPQRLKILELISHQKLNVSEINEYIDLPQNLLSYHLKALEENGFVSSERMGKHVIYFKTKNVTLENKNIKLNLDCCELKFKRN